MYEINPPGPKEGEDVFGFEHDPDLAERKRIKLPMLLQGNVAPQELLLADAVVLPRDYDKKAEKRLRRLRKLGAPDVPMPVGAATSFMSVNRHVVTTQWDARKGSLSVREQLDRLLEKRKLVVYVDRSKDEPVRIAVLPPLLSGELDAMFKKAGYTVGGQNPKRIVVGSMGLLTETSKMGCYSFNLPAGPRSVGGTCPASGLGFMYDTVGSLIKSQAGKRDKSTMIDPERFICNGCYAMKGAYGNPSTVANMQIRLVLVRALLSGKKSNVFYVGEDEFRALKKSHKERHGQLSGEPRDLFEKANLRPVKTTFSALMILAINEARARVAERRAMLESFGYTVSEYERTEEILEWLQARKRIRALVKELGDQEAQKEVNKILPNASRSDVQAEIDALLRKHGMTMEEALARTAKHKKVFADWQLPDPGYFRIHDAGDMFSDAYFREWLKVCEYFERGSDRVQFWAPTRMWAFAGGLRDDSLRSIPANLALRPSTLHFRDEAPSRHYLHKQLKLPAFKRGVGGGLSAPSGSAPEKPSEHYFKCPAYEHWSTGVGGAIRLDPRTQKGVGGTCITARGPNRENGCRACWSYNDLVVFYEEH